jgi:hypothetical protein
VLVAALLGCVLYLAAASSPTTGLWSHRFGGDWDVYEFYAQKTREGEAPYRDFLIEYPPGSLVAFVPPLLTVEGLQHLGFMGLGYVGAFKASMLICGFLIVFVVASTANQLWRDPRRVVTAAAVVGISPLVLGPTTLNWYDIWPTLLTIGTVAFFVRRRFDAASTFLGVAIAAKLFALVLVPLLVFQALRTLGWKRTLRAGTWFVLSLALFFGTAATLSLKGARYPISYLVDRPVEIESTAGSITGLFRLAGWWHLDTDTSYGSVNFEGRQAAILGVGIAITEVGALLALWWRLARGSLSPEALIALCTAAIAIALACSKVFSPQYLVWLVPFVALSSRRTALLALAVAAVLTRIWFPERWSEFNNIPPMFALAFPRNLAVILLAVLLIYGSGSREASRSSRLRRWPPLEGPS